MTQIPDAIKAKSFQLVDDEGNVRAELGCRTLKHKDSVEVQPILELRGSDGQARVSAWLDYFDQPKLVMRETVDGDDQESLTLEIRSDGAWVTLLGRGEDRTILSSGNAWPE